MRLPGRIAPRAFTLVQALVSVAIVIVLSAIVFVATAPARERARQSVCAQQLRQLFLAHELYNQDWNPGIEIDGLPPMSFAVSGSGFKQFKTYLGSEDVLYCPDLPPVYRQKIGTSYIYFPVADYKVPNPTPGEQGMLGEQRERIKKMGTNFPLWVCKIHDEVYYQPREAPVDFSLSDPFVVEVSVTGGIYRGRRPYHRVENFRAWDLLQDN